MEATSPPVIASPVEEWFERRSYDQAQFADLGAIARKKRELGLSLSIVLPTREVAGTIGAIIDEIHAVGARTALVDQLLVIDAGSADGSAEIATRRGAEVHLESELVPRFGPALGKGDAMWRALSVARGDIVMYLDADTTDFGGHFVYGLLGPLLDFPEIGFVQPLAGELAARRDLLHSIPFFTGYAVETGMLIDVIETEGLDAMAQVDLGTRTNRNQGLHALSRMSFEVLRAVEICLRADGRLSETAGDDAYVQAIRSNSALELDHNEVVVVERPPMTELR